MLASKVICGDTYSNKSWSIHCPGVGVEHAALLPGPSSVKDHASSTTLSSVCSVNSALYSIP
ncbi:hypothetical protein AZE42_14088 [Rhizopogon vesiculosus]|uniref:Uncharacterized protein n=1 Tax=Rhizopogon vesiculosus TaxID=180088 RepID=A0A1J8QX51_9AGAM|nr:hypothetical protein AZE42_14088 [Rhizopogon vesiculosus]